MFSEYSLPLINTSRFDRYALEDYCAIIIARWQKICGVVDLGCDPYGIAEKLMLFNRIAPVTSQHQIRICLSEAAPLTFEVARETKRWLDSGLPLGARLYWGDLSCGLLAHDFGRSPRNAFVMYADWLSYKNQSSRQCYEYQFDIISSMKDPDGADLLALESVLMNFEHARVWLIASIIFHWITLQQNLCQPVPEPIVAGLHENNVNVA